METVCNNDLDFVTDEDLGYEDIEDLAYTTEIDPYDEYMDSQLEKEFTEGDE